MKSETEVMTEALERIKSIVTGNRNECYGNPSVNHNCTAVMVSAYLTRKFKMPINIDGEDICVFNNLQKMSRHAHWRQEDNWTDSGGYAVNGLACSYASSIETEYEDKTNQLFEKAYEEDMIS